MVRPLASLSICCYFGILNSLRAGKQRLALRHSNFHIRTAKTIQRCATAKARKTGQTAL